MRLRSVGRVTFAFGLATACLPGLAACAGTHVGRAYYPVAVWYDVAAGRRASDRHPAAGIEDDFRTLRRLGFNTVFFRSLGATDRDRLIEVATSYGVRAAVPDPEAFYYVRTGRLPGGRLSLGSLAASIRRSRAAVVQLGLVTDAPAAERLRRLAGLCGEANAGPWLHAAIAPSTDVELGDLGVALSSPMPFITYDGRAAASGRRRLGNMAVIRVTRREDGSEPPVRSWLLSYHVAIASGQTAGLLFEQFRGSVHGWRGIVDAGGHVSARQAAMIRRITGRARLWGPMLRDTVASPIKNGVSGAKAHQPVDVVLLSGGKRRYVLLVNRSPDRFVRSPLEVPAAFGAGPATRLVRVPVRGGPIVGEVCSVRRNRVTLSTNLAPCDACLYEVF